MSFIAKFSPKQLCHSFINKSSAFSAKPIYNLCNFHTSNVHYKSLKTPGKVVFISQSTDVFSNLAFEDWLYQNWTFEKRHVLLLWRNSPCVVIGRHQNPYYEANIPFLESAGVPVVRRHSGGGTVYHDEGNLNLTFFSSRKRYNRAWNLELIRDCIQQDFGIDAIINKRDDILINNKYKISGTAAKLGRLAAYHHCTMLVATDKRQMKIALKGEKDLQSKATLSTPADVANLKTLKTDLTVEKFLGAVGQRFLGKPIDPQLENDHLHESDGFTLINPTEEWFPGIDTLRDKLTSWHWLYGMTPLFKANKQISLQQDHTNLQVSVKVFHGLIEGLAVSTEEGEILSSFDPLLSTYMKVPYSQQLLQEIYTRVRYCTISPHQEVMA